MCEIPDETIINAKVYVDSKEACLNEAGDLIKPINKGIITSNHIFAEIGEVVNNVKEGRNSKDNITIFKSVGNAVQDIAAAFVILKNAAKLKIGTEINL
jgi:ornithine cyclodeaminase/alanine dehydrogenase-like protein (mu-crystallin family)